MKRGAAVLIFSEESERKTFLDLAFMRQLQRANRRAIVDLYATWIHPGQLGNPYDGTLE